MKKRFVLLTSALMAIGLMAGCSSHNHDWGEVTYVWSKDNKICTAERVCKDDASHKETETRQATYSIIEDATCTEDGIGQYVVTFDNAAFQSQSKNVVIDALEHDYRFDSFIWTTDIQDYSAQAKYVCSHDPNHVQLYDAEISVDHTLEPTCEDTGLWTWTASYEGHNETKTETIPAKEHVWSGVVYAWSDGYRKCTATRECLNDPSHIDAETVKAVITGEEGAGPTCDASGYGRSVATFANPLFQQQVYEGPIPALGHDFEFDCFVWGDDFTAKAKYVCTHDDSHVEYYDADVTSEVGTEPECDRCGIMIYTASYDGHTDTASDFIPPAHKWGAPTYSWSRDHSTCTAKALCVYDSSHELKETVNATSTSTASYAQAGVRTFTATFASPVFEEQTAEVDEERIITWDKLLFSALDNGNACEVGPSEGGDLGIVSIPDIFDGKPVSRVADQAFLGSRNHGCSEVYFGQNIRLVAWQAFDGAGLTKAVFTGNAQLTAISDDAFARNPGLTTITLPASLYSIGASAFAGCTGLEEIIYEGTMQQWNDASKGNEWNADVPASVIHCNDGDVDNVPNPLPY